MRYRNCKLPKALETIQKQQLTDIANGEFSEEDLENAKRLIVSSVDAISEEQDTEITYYYGQELSDRFYEYRRLQKQIFRSYKGQVIELAKKTLKLTQFTFLKD